MPEAAYLQRYATQAVSYAVAQSVDEVLAASAALTFTLPKASTCFPGQTFTFVNQISGGGIVTVTANATDNIDGGANGGSDTTLQAIGANATYITDGALTWNKIGKDGGRDLPPQDLYVTVALGAFAASLPLWTAPNDLSQWQVKAASARFTTASSSGTLQVETAPAATAPGSGTVQLTGTVSLAGTANTTVNGTVIASPTAISAGMSVNAVTGGTMTSLAGAVLTLVLKRIA